MNSVSAEEAVARAKAIAARLSGSTTALQDDSTSKRKRWGVTPDDDSKKPKYSVEPFQKRLWITKTTEERPAWHFCSYLTRNFESLLDHYNPPIDASLPPLSLELHGRGSPNQSMIPGVPLEPLHVVISGPPDLVPIVEERVSELIQVASEAELEPQENNTDLKLLLQNIDNGNSSYRPASVSQLIGVYGPSGTDSGDWLEEDVPVPNGVVGFIIGRGGENIASMQNRTGVKVQIQKEHDLQPGQTMRIITLQGNNREAIQECRSMIEAMVQERTRGNSHPRDAKVHDALAAGHVQLQVLVPDADVGLIIGKQGSQIRQIQEESGAQIQVPPTSDTDNQRQIHITAPNDAMAQHARQLIEDLLKSRPTFSNGPVQGPQVSIQVMIPDRDVGLCIGRQGCVIKHMQNVTGCRIQIPPQANMGETHRVATVSGPQDGCQKVQAMVEQIMAEQSSAGVLSGAPRAMDPYQQYQQQQANGGADYSAEWAAYHAAQAAAQQQYASAPVAAAQSYAAPAQQFASAPAAAAQSYSEAAAPASAASEQPASDTYYEQFFRYAYYYGEEAARGHYGAWSPPIGTPNPYGTNPNGTTAAPGASATNSTPNPASASSAPAAPAPAPVIDTAVAEAARETSRRKVSNLPAWMTKN